MKEHRMQVFRSAIEGLIESLEAVIRLSRWDEAEAKPEPLVSSAGKLLERLGTADRLSSAKFHGTPTEMNKVGAMCAVLKRLDVAYLAYRQQIDAPQAGASTSDAVAALETELASLDSAAWT
ncbi:MAG TPA: hypothetical protein VM925_27575 [Labilithrix sp.]|nr:hypothetical protein [Labilithrix sp.]